jgi:Peptidase family M1 domain
MKCCGWQLLCFFMVCALAFSSAVNALALDREAFGISKYDLQVRIDPAQQRLGVRGKITLRNDSASSQKIAVLQISSSLSWLSIRERGKLLQFISQPYNSDIDHTGALSEAIVTLPGAVAPKSTTELEIAYEGVVPLDATRLIRIETPEDAARSTDWDQISSQFTGVRGTGYVTWYPIATDAASLSQDMDLFDVLSRWKRRESASSMHLQLVVSIPGEAEKPELLVNAASCPTAHEQGSEFLADCTYGSLAWNVPTFVIANYEVIERPHIAVHFLRGHDESAANYANAAEKVVPLITDWFGAPRGKAETADLADPDAAQFESGPLLLTPLAGLDSKLDGLAAAHQLTHAAISSPRPWINEGLAHFAQALYLQQQKGSEAALEYMRTHGAAFTSAQSAQQSSLSAQDQTTQSLINTADEQLYRSKAMYVWWMLRDMIGDQALKKALASYRPEQDKEPSYMQRLIQAQTQRDVEWFFDDWVYRDRGLPDFKVESAFTRKLLPEGYMVTITIDNAGTAGAEVPVTVKSAGGDVTKRLVVRGKSNAVIRMESVSAPEEIVVNDGSVPESDTANNSFKIDPGDIAK